MSEARIIHELHDDFGVTLSEAKKAYDIAAEYIRLRSTIGDHPEDYEPSEYMLIKASAESDVTDINVGDTIFRQAAINAVHKNYDTILDFKSDGCTVASSFEDIINALPPTQPEYEPVTIEDFAKTMSENTLYGFMAWHGEAFTLIKEMGFEICKKTM